MGTVVRCRPPLPIIFFGHWALFGAGEFSGGALIPKPRFAGSALRLEFPVPVWDVGANLYDDADGTPAVNRLGLVVTTVSRQSFSWIEAQPGARASGRPDGGHTAADRTRVDVAASSWAASAGAAAGCPKPGRFVTFDAPIDAAAVPGTKARHPAMMG